MHSSRLDGQGSDQRARVAFGISSYISLGNRFFDFRAGSALTIVQSKRSLAFAPISVIALGKILFESV